MPHTQSADGARDVEKLPFIKFEENDEPQPQRNAPLDDAQPPTFLGMPLKYVSLVTLAVQNALLTIIMHYSRVSTPPSRAYSAAAAVLMNELLKGGISMAIAFVRLDYYASASNASFAVSTSLWRPQTLLLRFRRLGREVFSPDCWKLSIPAILYVIQNNLQYVAASNLDAATFQVTYQMKILTTAFFSVLMLRKRLSPVKWAALIFLALGVGVVQIQSGAGHAPSSAPDVHTMFPFKGFLAVTAACFTSGLAGVYFEMVLKNSQADLWVRNVQLSLFSLLPALVPIIWNGAPREAGAWFGVHLFRNFGPWAWATVAIQVFGGLITALVIKFADNILKGFATSLSIVISFLASVALFDMQLTFSFILGSSIVLVATWLYNQPENQRRASGDWSFMGRRPALSRSASALGQAGLVMSQAARKLSASSLSLSSLTTLSTPPSPTEDTLPMYQPSSLFDSDKMDDKLDKPVPQSFKTVAAAFGLSSPPPPQEILVDIDLSSSVTIDDFRSQYPAGQHCFLAPSLSRGSSSQRLPSRAHSPDLIPTKPYHQLSSLSGTRPPSRLAQSTSAPGAFSNLSS
ncbi:hypothetical protein PUNSTDRAFT_104902 [Punctularia strigosozonata HHB-11173 SS5]|uniref:uncharacterized protein n=1 Tax=Punctularia strigosozonata (strain HHB-11173) TaxID=741275 RepID=UPI0004417F71|nr:uncharacterized protein PUNSTDRAFT_104902 [Punctularia strigosozonata HHB-11173 SS5]EIN07283.1 hypothetical protein PUNSTDRAFT_104902 [Punctularia strigosozonata HHB-11173 SS5]